MGRSTHRILRAQLVNLDLLGNPTDGWHRDRSPKSDEPFSTVEKLAIREAMLRRAIDARRKRAIEARKPAIKPERARVRERPLPGFTPDELAAINAAIAAGRLRRVAYDADPEPTKVSWKFKAAFYLSRHRFLVSRGIDYELASAHDIAQVLNAENKRTVMGAKYDYQLAQGLRDNIRRALNEKRTRQH
jgi:hypothetical protein